MTMKTSKILFDKNLTQAMQDAFANVPEEYVYQGVRLVLTCIACPEQYDAFDEKTSEQVGYLRLRHGTFRVDVPDCGGETVFIAEPLGSGGFEEVERTKYLNLAIEAIKKKIAD